jgi:hypothetical protein
MVKHFDPQNGKRPKQYNLGGLPYINLGTIKQLSDNYNVQINFIFDPDKVQMRIYRIDPNSTSKSLTKSEKVVFKNEELATKFNPNVIEMIIRNVLSDWYPSTMLST